MGCVYFIYVFKSPASDQQCKHYKYHSQVTPSPKIDILSPLEHTGLTKGKLSAVAWLPALLTLKGVNSTCFGLEPSSANTRVFPLWVINCIRHFDIQCLLSIKSLLPSPSRHLELSLITLPVIFHHYLLIVASSTIS